MRNHRVFAALLLVTAAIVPATIVPPRAAWADPPTSSPAFGIMPVASGIAETGHVLKASGGNLYSVRYTNQTNLGGFLATINTAALPASGTPITPVDCVPVTANNFIEIDYSPGPPDVYSTGIVVVFSTSCWNYTPGAGSGLFKGRVQ